jgi:hypothetical protein
VPLRQLRPRTTVTALIVVAVLGAGWYLYGRVLDDPLVNGPVTGAALVWHPGVNSGGAAHHSSVNGSEARRLAQVLNHTSRSPEGPVNCPADFGSEVRVTFHGAGHQDQRVTIALTGCAGPTGRAMSEALKAELEGLAPRGSGLNISSDKWATVVDPNTQTRS